MYDLLTVIVIGMGVTAGMSLCMWGIHRFGLANANMVEALGSIVSRKKEGALGVGLVCALLVFYADFQTERVFFGILS